MQTITSGTRDILWLKCDVLTKKRRIHLFSPQFIVITQFIVLSPLSSIHYLHFHTFHLPNLFPSLRFKKEQDSNFFDNWSMIYFTIKPQKEGRFRSGESFNYWSDTIYFYYYIIIIFNFIVRRKKIWIIRIMVR